MNFQSYKAMGCNSDDPEGNRHNQLKRRLNNGQVLHRLLKTLQQGQFLKVVFALHEH